MSVKKFDIICSLAGAMLLNLKVCRVLIICLRDGPGGAPFDPSDFPSLGGGAGGALGGSGRNNYGMLPNLLVGSYIRCALLVGMVKQPADHSSEFQMSNEDFPALPGAPAAEPGSSNSILESVKLPTAGLTPEQVFL